MTFCGIKGRVCADTGSSFSIAGERMYQAFKDKRLPFQESTLSISLADGQQTTGGEATTILEHHINTENSPLISVPITLRKRGRPSNVPQTPGSSSEPEGEDRFPENYPQFTLNRYTPRIYEDILRKIGFRIERCEEVVKCREYASIELYNGPVEGERSASQAHTFGDVTHGRD
ncbi:hypothetical protein TNCV_4497651 [Trichonephila clavipes]|nr:hypothetical protein TNCV_4497651 [Trichonephila clavipes]